MKKVPLPFLDKIGHIILYAGLGIIVFELTLSYFPRETLKVIILFSILCGTIYGGLDELHQRYIPGRTSSVFDFIADLFGTVLGIFLVAKRFKKRKRI